jgi:ribosomal protein S18 acetylase RimI-like enzyme
MPDIVVRPARTEEADAAARLLFESSAELYERYAGGRERALSLLRAMFAAEGNGASREVVTLAELDGRPAAAMAAYPVGESLERARRGLRLSLRRIPPWVWPATLRIYRLGSRHVPPPPPGCFYVDALATEAGARRRGAATALLAEAERRAHQLHLDSLALETELENAGAQALYEGFGFEARAHCGPAGPLPGFISYVKRL